MEFPTLMVPMEDGFFALDVTRGYYDPRRKKLTSFEILHSNANGIFHTLMDSDGGWIFALDVTRGAL